MYLIYKATSPSGKFYIGMTKKTLEKRKIEHINHSKYRKKLGVFQQAIKKYGGSNFVWEVLFNNLSKEDAFLKEIELISLHNTTNRQFGYNMHSGGAGGGNPMTKEGFNKFKTQMEKHYSNPDWRKKVSKSRIEMLKNNPTAMNNCHEARDEFFKNPQYAKEREERLQKIHANPNSRRILSAKRGGKPFKCIETDQIFYTLGEAVAGLNLPKENKYRHAIYKVLIGKNAKFNELTFQYIKGE